MNPNFDWSSFEPVNNTEEPEQQAQQTSPQIDWNQFETVSKQQAPKEKPYDNRIEYMRKHGASEEDIAEFEAENAGVELEGSAQAYKELPRGLLSGATAGFSGLIPNFEPQGPGGEGAKLIGSLMPITLAAKTISYPLKAAATKSPIIQKGLKSFAELVGLSAAGGLYGGLEESAENTKEKGEFVAPSLDSVLEHGMQWAALDAALKAVGWTGRFGKALAEKALKSGKPAEAIMEDIASKVGSDNVAEKAISILENKPLKEIKEEAVKAGNPIGGNTSVSGEAELLPSGERKVTLGGKSDVTPQSKTKEYAALEFGTRPEEKGIDLKNKKVSPKTFEKLESGQAATPEPYLPGEFQAETIAEENLFSDIDRQIEKVSPRAATEKELGEGVQAEIENTVKEHKKTTDDLYAIAKEVEETKAPKVKKTADAIVEQIKKIEAGGMSLTPEGYNKAKKQLMDTLKDLGYGVETGADGLVIRAIEHQRQPLSKVVEVKRRLNNIINYDLLETSAGDFLKGPAHELRGEIRAGYGPKNSKARKAFEKAEKEFGEFAEKKGKKSIRNMRTTEKPEEIAKVIRTPSGLADIKEVVSKEHFARIERELLEHLKAQNEEKASRLYRELRPSLSPESRSIAEQIIEAKAPRESPLRKVAQSDAIKRAVIDDISKATLTGQRPKVALDLWKTKEGQQLVKQSLENSPNKQEVLKYLQDQSFKDFTGTVINPDGQVNFKKLNEMLKDPATATNIRLVAGEEGLSFLKNLENLSTRIQKNADILERTIAKSTAPEREKLVKEINKQGKDRFERLNRKNTALTKEEEAFKSKFNKKAKEDREEVHKSLREKGTERFRKSKEHRAELSKQEQLAQEERERSGIMYKIDDLVSSYGLKGKGVLAALGIWKIGTIEGLSLAAGYEIFMRLAKNKTLRDAIKRAATTNPRNNLDILMSITAIEKAMDSSDQ